jgi:hypothetical protein
MCRDGGCLRDLWPIGVDHAADMPHTFNTILQRSLAVLRWQENAWKPEHVPPKRIWDDDEKLNLFFEQVEKEKEREMKGGKDKTIEDPVSNDAAGSLIAG